MLTELSVQSLKPRAQRFMRADRDGLYIEVVPAGQKYWWYVSQAGGKRKKISIGKWPDVSLKEARELLVLKKREAGISSFSPEVDGVLLSEIAEEWYRVRISGFSEGYKARVRRWLDNNVLLYFKGRSLASVTGHEILDVCRWAENLIPLREIHYANVPDHRDITNLMQEIERYPRPRVRNALLFSAYTFCRPGEVRRAEWNEFDLD